VRRPLWWLRVAAAVTIAAVHAMGVWIRVQVVRLAADGVASVTDLLEGVDAARSELIVLTLSVPLHVLHRQFRSG
jgi:hypothetical protein